MTGTRDLADPSNFKTPDWAVVSNLPAGRSGMAAFVANQEVGDCEDDDQSGALMLNSPLIEIPADVVAPRLSIYHWFDLEYGWDGGNLKISRNGGFFKLVPASSFEFNPYNERLEPTLDNGVAR
jgi:hypothetical protein